MKFDLEQFHKNHDHILVIDSSDTDYDGVHDLLRGPREFFIPFRLRGLYDKSRAESRKLDFINNLTQTERLSILDGSDINRVKAIIRNYYGLSSNYDIEDIDVFYSLFPYMDFIHNRGNREEMIREAIDSHYFDDDVLREFIGENILRDTFYKNYTSLPLLLLGRDIHPGSYIIDDSIDLKHLALHTGVNEISTMGLKDLALSSDNCIGCGTCSLTGRYSHIIFFNACFDLFQKQELCNFIVKRLSGMLEQSRIIMAVRLGDYYRIYHTDGLQSHQFTYHHDESYCDDDILENLSSHPEIANIFRRLSKKMELPELFSF